MGLEKREIPAEILRHILRGFPSKRLVRSKVVSKNLNDLISDPYFVEQYHQKSKRNPNLLSIDIENSKTNEKSVYFIFKYLDSQGRITEIFSKEVEEFRRNCKEVFDLKVPATKYEGLVCIHAKSCHACDSYKDYVYIFNPVTKQLVSLPQSSIVIPYPPPLLRKSSLIAFGYSASSNEYKIVRFFSTRFRSGDYEKRWEILSFLGTSKSIQEANWRVIDDKCNCTPSEESIFVNNHFYWYEVGSHSLYPFIAQNRIIILDTASYKFSIHPNPQVIQGRGILMELKGELGIYEFSSYKNTINLYKTEDYENWIWNKVYEINLNVNRELSDCFSRVAPHFRCTVDGDLMFFSFDTENFLCKDDDIYNVEDAVDTVIFNLETKEFTMRRILGQKVTTFYYDTIVSLL